MPELSEEQWGVLITIFSVAWELVDEADGDGRGGHRYTLARSRLTPLRDALLAFEVVSGGEDSPERVSVLMP